MATAWRVVLGIACACACGRARADVVKLAELEARALAHRPEIEAGAARVRQADAQIDAVESTYWPTVGANVDASLAPGRTLLTYPDPDSGRDYLISGTQAIGSAQAFLPVPRYGGSIAARGNLYDFGRTRSALAAARAKQRASQADAQARAETLVLELRAAYLRWSVAQASWEIAKQTQAAAQARAERVAGLIAEGASPPSAATSAGAQANAAASESERALLELETARSDLAYLSARDLGPDALPDPTLLAGETPAGTRAPPPSAAGASPSQPSAAGPRELPSAAAAPALPPSAAAGGNPRIQALETAHAAAEAQRLAEARGSAPVLGYRLNAGIEGQSGDVFPVYAVGVGLTVPLWDGGATSAAEAGARAAAAELAAQLEAERARDTHLRAQRTMQTAHVERLVELAEAAVALAEMRLAQLEAGPTLASAEQAAIAEAEAERSRSRAELVRARATRAQLRLGLL